MNTIKLYCCENSAAELLGSEEFRKAHPSIQVETVRCGGQVNYLATADSWGPETIVTAFLFCPQDNCRFLHGTVRGADELSRLERDWADVGVSNRRLMVRRMASCRPGDLARFIQEIEQSVEAARG